MLLLLCLPNYNEPEQLLYIQYINSYLALFVVPNIWFFMMYLLSPSASFWFEMWQIQIYIPKCFPHKGGHIPSMLGEMKWYPVLFPAGILIIMMMMISNDDVCGAADWFLLFKYKVKFCPAVWSVYFPTYRIASCQKQRGNVLRRKQECWKDYNIPTSYVFMTPGRDPPKAGSVLYWSPNSWLPVLSKRECWCCWYSWLDHLDWNWTVYLDEWIQLFILHFLHFKLLFL